MPPVAKISLSGLVTVTSRPATVEDLRRRHAITIGGPIDSPALYLRTLTRL